MTSFLDDPRWSTKQIFNTTAAQVVYKDSIWIIQIADDQIETREIIYQFCWQFRVPREEAGERPVLDRACCLRVKPIFRKYRNVLVTKNLDMRTRTGVPQRLERRQGENEIADRAAADHQNAPEHRLLVCAPSGFASRCIENSRQHVTL